MKIRTWLTIAALGLSATPLSAQEYPSQPLTVVVPFVAGGPTDTVASILVDAMAKHLPQPIFVQNVGGAGGTVGVRQVASAPPDGHILLLNHIGMATAPSLYRSLPYDPVGDFVAIGEIADVPMTIVSRPDLPADSLQELIAYIRANGPEITIANAGLGSASQLCGLLLMRALEQPLTVVEYPGTGPAMSDVARSRIDIVCDQTTNTTVPINEGRVKAFAITTDARLSTLPDVPTTSEAGLTDFSFSIWHGLFVPKDTSPEIVLALEIALANALRDRDLLEQLANLGVQPVSQDRAASQWLTEKLAVEIEHWREVLETAGAYVE